MSIPLNKIYTQFEERKKIEEDQQYAFNIWKSDKNENPIIPLYYLKQFPESFEYFIPKHSLIFEKKDENLKEDPWFFELEILNTHHDLGVDSSSHKRQKVASTLWDRMSVYCSTQIGKDIIYKYLLIPTYNLDYLENRKKIINWMVEFLKTEKEPFSNYNLSKMEKNIHWYFQDLKPEIQVLLTKIYLQWDWFSFISDFLNKNIIYHRLIHIYKIYLNPGIQIFLPIVIFLGSLFGSIWLIKKSGFSFAYQFWTSILKTLWKSSTSGKSKLTILITVGLYIFSFFYNIYQSIRDTIFLQNIYEQLYQSILPVLQLIKYCDYYLKKIPSFLLPLELKKSLTSSLIIFKKIIHPSLLSENYENYSSFWQKWVLYPRSEICTTFYQIYQEKDKLLPCLTFLGYIDSIQNLAQFIIQPHQNISWASYIPSNQLETFTQNNNIQKIPDIQCKEIYYPLLFEKSIANPFSISLKKGLHKIITGPNAAGKSTYLKSIGLNQHLAQTIGFVFAKDYTCCLFEQFHSQLQLQDLKGAYSLFEAEMLRCQVFLEKIQNKKMSLCLFDELFSSTNAQEGFASAFAFVEYCIHKKHISFLLTTHYGLLKSLVKKYPKIVKIIRFDTEKHKDTGRIIYPYKMKLGCSKQSIALELLSYQSTSKEWINRAKEVLEVLQKLDKKQCNHLLNWIDKQIQNENINKNINKNENENINKNENENINKNINKNINENENENENINKNENKNENINKNENENENENIKVSLKIN